MLWLLILLALALAFAIAGLSGAPYVPILGRDTEPLLDLAGVEAGQTVVDLGSGDGRLLRAAVRRGADGIGYELNPVMVLIAKLMCWPMRRHVKIHLANLWTKRLPQADVVYVFLLPKHLARLHHKLAAEIRTPTRVVSYSFEIPGALLIAKNRNTFVYQYGG
jgi:SAM-dependent methyltransferase